MIKSLKVDAHRELMLAAFKLGRADHFSQAEDAIKARLHNIKARWALRHLMLNYEQSNQGLAELSLSWVLIDGMDEQTFPYAPHDSTLLGELNAAIDEIVLSLESLECESICFNI